MKHTLAAFAGGALLAACHGAGRGGPLVPPDPFRPEIRPDLADCEWMETIELAQYGDDPGTYTRRTRYDGEGRPVSGAAGAEYDDGTFNSDAWSTRWDGLCPTHDTHDGEDTRAGRHYVFSETATTQCDEHDNRTEVYTKSTAGEIVADGTEVPGSWSEGTLLYDNRYAAGRLVEAITLSSEGNPWGEAVTYDWAGPRLILRRTEAQDTPYTVRVVEERWEWDGERLSAGTVVDDRVPGPMTWKHVFDGDRWLGGNSENFDEAGAVVYTSTFRWLYDDGWLPVGSRSEPSSGGTIVSHIVVTCD